MDINGSDFTACCSGKATTGAPIGYIIKIAGRDAYITGDRRNKALMILPDVFGISTHMKLLADKYAKEAGVTVFIPDIFGGEPAPIKFLDKPNSTPNDFILDFLGRNRKEKRYPEIVAVATELRKKYGIDRLFAMGICFGGWAAVLLSADKLVDAIIVAHPALIDFPMDVQNIATPSLWLLAQNDKHCPKSKREVIEAILKEKPDLHSKVVFYPGTTHGFIVRGDDADEVVRAAACDATWQGILFVKSLLEYCRYAPIASL